MNARMSNIMQQFLGNNARTILQRKNILATFLLKACSGIITLLLVPLTLKCLGVYANGVWMTISASLVLFENLDIGLGNGLRNKLTEFLAKKDVYSARVAVSSTLFLLLAIIVPITTILVCVCYIFNMNSLLNVSPDIIPNLQNVVCVCIILFGATFIMKFISNIYLGLQMPAVSNFLITGGHPIILAGTYYMYANEIHSLMYIAALNMAVPLIMYLLAYPYTFYRKYVYLRPSLSLFSRRMSVSLFSMGIMFFFNQVSGTIVFFSSNIMVSRWFEPSFVTPYQIAYRYFSIPFLVFTVVNAPNWSATTDAFFKKDIDWIRSSVHQMNRMLLIFFLILVVMVLISQPVYGLWIGKNIKIDFNLTMCMAMYMFIMMYSLAYCYYLNGIGALRLQLVCTIIGIVIYFVSAWILFQTTHNVLTICLAMTLSLVPNAISNKIQFTMIINGKANGIWRK